MPALSASVHPRGILQVQTRLLPTQAPKKVTSTGKDQVSRLISVGPQTLAQLGAFPSLSPRFPLPISITWATATAFYDCW